MISGLYIYIYICACVCIYIETRYEIGPEAWGLQKLGVQFWGFQYEGIHNVGAAACVFAIQGCMG